MSDIKAPFKLSIGEKLHIIRKTQKLTQVEFGERIGMGQSYIVELEKGRRKPSYDTILKIMKTFHVNPDWLLSEESKHKELPMIVAESKTEYNIRTELVALPVINDVPAGYPDYPLDDEIKSYFYIPNVPKSVFGLIVSGNSMEPELYTGDIVVVNPNDLELMHGEIGVFRYRGGTTIKICMPLANNKGYILQPRNPTSEAYVVDNDSECIIIGKVIYKIVKCRK